MSINVLSLAENKLWDSTAKGFNDCDAYYLSGYAKSLEFCDEGDLFLILAESDNVKAMNVVLRRDVSRASALAGKVEEGRYFDFATPYGYGGWLVEGIGDFSCLLAEYESYCAQNGIVSEFVRFHPVLKNDIRVADFYEVVELGPTVALDLTSREAVWGNITSKNRNMIRKAQKNGIQIEHGSSAELYATFRKIYEETMDRDNADAFYYFPSKMYESLLMDFGDNAEIFYAVLNGEIIASSIMIYANGKLNYHLSGSVGAYRSLAPSNLLLYEAANWGVDQGFKILHLGGGLGSREDGLYKFKKSFYRGDPLHYKIGRKVFDDSAYRMLTDLRGGVNNDAFFPLYRS